MMDEEKKKKRSRGSVGSTIQGVESKSFKSGDEKSSLLL